jgi:hypothetical protein
MPASEDAITRSWPLRSMTMTPAAVPSNTLTASHTKRCITSFA